MRTLMAALTLALLAACGGDGPTEPAENLPSGPLQMALVQGDGQEVQVTDTLPSDIIVEVTKGGAPLTDQLVDWAVLSDNCGTPFVTTTRTDSEGITGNRLVAGTRANTRADGPDVCQMEVRYAITEGGTVAAEVDTTVGYLVMPGVAMNSRLADYLYFSGKEMVRLDGDLITDQYGNPALWRLEPDCCAHREADEYGTVGARTLLWDSAGSDSVYAMVADSMIDAGTIETGPDGNVTVSFND